MAAETINIYSSRIDPAGVLRVLRTMTANIEVIGTEQKWSRIVLRIALKPYGKPALLSFGHDPAYYESPAFADQVHGLQAYLGQFPTTPVSERVMLLIGSFRFALSLHPPPSPQLDLDSRDLRIKYIHAVAEHLDGVILTPTSLRDAKGRVILDSRGKSDPDAVLPTIYKKPPLPEDRSPLAPPAPVRVARRALALAAVGARCLLEREKHADPNVERTRTLIEQWINDIGIQEEVEPDEWKLLQHPLGVSATQEAVNGVWRLEGLGVLAWALGLYELPPYDQLILPGELLPAMGLLNPERALAILQQPTLRPATELQKLATHLLGIHWRLREFRLNKKPMDFQNFAANAWFDKLPMDQIRLVNNDLALGTTPISKAHEDTVIRCTSAAHERHLAINWLRGESLIYSQTDTST